MIDYPLISLYFDISTWRYSMTRQEIIIRAHELARGRSFGELEKSFESREPTKVENLACHFALQREIEERVASEKTETLEAEKQYDKDRLAALLLYDNAKEAFRIEKVRHRETMEGFAEEIARHRAEKERHKIIEAGFVLEKTKHTAERDRHEPKRNDIK
jgi:hypothetical protein